MHSYESEGEKCVYVVAANYTFIRKEFFKFKRKRLFKVIICIYLEMVKCMYVYRYLVILRVLKEACETSRLLF